LNLKKVKKGGKIEFLKSVKGEHALVEAIISSEKIFKVPKEKVGKFVVGKSDETDHFESKKNESYFESTLNKFWSKINLKNSNDVTVKVDNIEPDKSQKIGGQKRKSTDANLSDENEDDKESDPQTSISI
jgi:hypothetical protein